MFNALQSIQAFESGQGQRKERERESAMKNFGNALSMNDYEGASKIGFGIDPALGMQARQYGESQNALALNKQIAPMVAAGNYTEAMTLAAPSGNLDLVTQLQQFKQNATLQERQEAAYKAGELAKIAARYEGMAPDQAAASWAQDQLALQQQGFDPAELAQFDPSDPNDIQAAIFSAQTLSDIQAGQRYDAQQAYTQKIDERNWQAQERARREASIPRDTWQSAGDGYIFNNRTGESRSAAGGAFGGGVGASGGGFGDDPNAFMIPTSSMDYNPFVQMQFGGNLTQGAPSFFDNGEIYQPGATDTAAAPGGGRPPNVTATYDRYRSSELAKNDNKELGNARTEAIAVTSTLLPQIQEMRSLVGTFPMGITSDAQYQIGRVAGDAFGLGMSGEEQGNRDAFRGQAKKLALSLGRDLKPFSNSDRDWIEAMVANPGNSEQSAEKVLDTLEKMAEYRLFYAQGAEMWQNQYGGLSMTDAKGKNFFESWGEWSSMNPVTGKQFSGDAPTSGPTTRGSVRSGAAGGRGAVSGGQQYERTATNPQTGEKIGLVNGQWVPIQ